MTVIHIVLFKFNPTIQAEVVRDACSRMLDLRNKCEHPETKKPYIVSSSGGRDHSVERMQGGFSHGFVVEFGNEQDRDYYVKQDPAHLSFVKSLDGIVEEARIIDYSPGVY